MNTTEYQKIIERFTNQSAFNDWLLTLEPSATSEVAKLVRHPENFIRGCQVSTWILAQSHSGAWQFKFDSDSASSRGITRILVSVLSGKTTAEIQAISFRDLAFLAVYLPSVKKKGLQAMLNHVKKITA
jgi:sulfur transfer protein SufE